MDNNAIKHAQPDQIFAPSKDFAQNAHIDAAKYQALYKRSLEEPDAFWADMAKRLDWSTFPSKIKNTSFAPDKVDIKWYEDGVLNVCHNCVDRHLPARADQTALIWESDDPSVDLKITYAALKDEVSRLANALKSRGVKKGDRVTIYMPMVLEAVYAMLACARIGAVHSVVFGGFSPDSLKDRIQDCESDIVITANEGVRGGRSVPLKNNVDEALKSCPDVHTVLVYQRTDKRTDMKDERDIWWHDLVPAQSTDCPCEPINAEDPLFILYTSGSTGKPKGVLHTSGGYLVYAAMTHEMVFDYKEGEIYWCTADVGWVTGHSYIVYGPLANGATSLVFEGVPHYPDASRFWNVVDKHKVNIFYTAPTAIRALLKEGNEPVAKTDRASLRVLGTVGEPINHEAWMWYHDIIGDGRCPIVDTWWQTETGGHMITPLPAATPTKPGAASVPFFGVQPAIVDTDGIELNGACEGALVIKESWPGQMRTVYKDHERFVQTYFSTFKGTYFTGDGARRDEDGYYWITGRMDDVLNISGHRLGTAEIESAINEHELIAESAVVGYPHDIKGQGIYAYVTLNSGAQPSDEIADEICTIVRRIIGPIAKPDIIQFADGLPKTRSGKIMRRILRKIVGHEEGSIGDISTLAEPAVLAELIKGRKS
jgi:acetyl-CoA synthetase